MNLRPAAAALFLALCTQTGMAEQHTATLGISARVVRSCAVQSATAGGTPVQLTCSRGATPGVVTGASSSVTRVPPLRTTAIESIQQGSTDAFIPASADAFASASTDALAPAAQSTPLFAVTEPGAGPPAGAVRMRPAASTATRMATPIAILAVPDATPASASTPPRSSERQVVTINF